MTNLRKVTYHFKVAFPFYLPHLPRPSDKCPPKCTTLLTCGIHPAPPCSLTGSYPSFALLFRIEWKIKIKKSNGFPNVPPVTASEVPIISIIWKPNQFDLSLLLRGFRLAGVRWTGPGSCSVYPSWSLILIWSWILIRIRKGETMSPVQTFRITSRTREEVS